MASVKERSARVRSHLIDRIDRVDLRVRDVERSLTFYRDVVGLEVAERPDGRAVLRSPGGPGFLVLDQEGVTLPADPRATGLFHIAIRFPTRAALGDALARLVAADLEIGAGDHLVSEALYIDDPDGNGVELYWDRPEDEWPEPTGESMVPMATLPVDLQGLLDEGRGRDAVDGPAPEKTDMGHVHLQVSNIGATTKFYAEEVGLDLTGHLGGSAAFFSSNGYHHHLGANTWRSANGKLSGRDRAGLERIVFGVSDPDRIEHLRLRLGSAGHQVFGDPDRSVEVRDPDGILIEFRPSTA